MAARDATEIFVELEALLRGKKDHIGLEEQLSKALSEYGKADADDAFAQRKALVEFLELVSILVQAILGARMNGPFSRLVFALSDANEGKPDPLLKPTPRNADKDDRKSRGAPPSPSSKVARMATFIGYADAVAVEVGVAKAEETIAKLIGMGEKAFSEQRKHGADYQSPSNQAIFKANRESGKASIIQQATKRNWSYLETVERLIPKLFESGAFAQRPRDDVEKS